MSFKYRVACCLLFVVSSLFATPQQVYLNRFQSYLNWNKSLPDTPTSDFIRFISQDAPLSNKLRARWLLKIGQKKDWKTFKKYYKPSGLTTLTCYNALADLSMGQSIQALNVAKSLWLNGQSQPGACRDLFEFMLKQPDFDERYIDARLILALNEDNAPLALYLLKQYHKPKMAEVKQLEQIVKRPVLIHTLAHDSFHGYFYLYGLKRLVSLNPKAALQAWLHALHTHQLSLAQQQQFLVFYTTYLATKNDPTTDSWFAQIQPSYYNDKLLDLQIRRALKASEWKHVETLIHYYRDKTDPCWQYWLARSLESQGKMPEAQTIYENLAKNRQFYGFLASLRLNHPLRFESETSFVHLSTLNAYQPITAQVTALLKQKHDGEASQLLSDFSSELPRDEKITLVHWVASVLKWYGKAIALSSSDDLRNQLVLRFPLAYRPVIAKMAKDYHLPEAFIYAIIRQESTFNTNIVSPAGAKGLMQLMPSTASLMAKKQHLPYHGSQELFHSPTNITLGTAYLKTLAQRFGNHLVLMAAAYNAGPTQAVYWLKNHTPKDMDVWIETLPWRETRNYLKNVIAFYAVYQYRILEQADIKDVIRPVD